MANDIALLSEAVYALRENFTTVAVDRGVNFDKEAGFALQILSGSDFMMSAAMNNRGSVENAITNIAAIGIPTMPGAHTLHCLASRCRKQIGVGSRLQRTAHRIKGLCGFARAYLCA